MPIIELDMMIAFVNASDHLHRVAVEIFRKIAEGELTDGAIPASAYIEYELLLRSRGYDRAAIEGDIETFRRFPNLEEIPLSSDILLKASKLRASYSLTYFDSLHAASALLYDGAIISVDEAYRRVEALRALDPRAFIDNSR